MKRSAHEQTLIELFFNATQRFSRRRALSMKPRWRTLIWTYADLREIVQGISVELARRGVGVGDRVVLIGVNSPQWIAAFWAIIARGAVVVPLNPQSTMSFVQRIMQETRAKVCIAHTRCMPQDVPVLALEDIEQYRILSEQYAKITISPQHCAEIVYTSGTTGEPKGVVLTHENIMSNVHATVDLFPLSPKDATVAILPLFHMFQQMAGMLLPLARGVWVSFVSSLSSRAISTALVEQRTTKMIMVPEMLETIARKIEHRAISAGREKFFYALCHIAEYVPYAVRRWLFYPVHRSFGGKLRLIVSGGAALPIEVERRWNAFGITVLQGYGLTETSPVLATNTLTQHAFGSVGKPVASAQVDIAADGEILASGKSVFSGYYHNETRTKEAFDEHGRFKTGDLGYFDGNGFLFLHGRKKYLIIGPGGENVYPEDIEFTLKEHPEIRDATVIGIDRNGREIVFAVLIGEFERPETIIEWANAKLAPYQHIQDWMVWPEVDFPRSATRKVKKDEVKALVMQHHASIHGKAAASQPSAPSPLIRVLSAVTGVSVHTIHTESLLVKDLNLDSLMRIELVSSIEEEFDIAVPEEAITSHTRVSDLQELIASGKKPEKGYSIRWWFREGIIGFLRPLAQLLLVFPFYYLFIRIRVEGSEYLDALREPVLFMPNHISFLDTVFVLRALPYHWRRRIAIAAARDFLYKKYWWIAWLFEWLFNTYQFPRTEGESIKPGLETTGEMLDHGFSVLIFPEGKLSEDGTLQPLKRGAGLLATEMRAPVVPVALIGVLDVVAAETLLPRRRGEITVRFGKPIRFIPGVSYDEATSDIERALRELLERK